MKNKILTFIIGVLVGAIIATGGFYIYEKTTKRDLPYGKERPEMIDGENPPERPDGERGNNEKYNNKK